LRVKIIAQGTTRDVKGKGNVPLQVCTFTVADDSGCVDYSAFGPEISEWSSMMGSVIDLEMAWVREWQGTFQLSRGAKGKYTVVNDPGFTTCTMPVKFVQKSPPDPNSVALISQAVENTTMTAKVRVISAAGKTRSVKMANGKDIQVCKLQIADISSVAYFNAFEAEIASWHSFVGNVVLLKQCWVKNFRGFWEFTTGKNGSWIIIPNDDYPPVANPTVKYPKFDTRPMSQVHDIQPNAYFHVEIAGLAYTHMAGYIASLPPMTPLELRPHPHNAHDPNAVGVWHGKRRLGYLPRVENKPFFKALTEKTIPLKCFLGAHTPRGLPAANPYSFYANKAFVTIHTFYEGSEVEWRPVALLPEDTMAL